MIDESTSLWTLFASSFLAATLLPGGLKFRLCPDQRKDFAKIPLAIDVPGDVFSEFSRIYPHRNPGVRMIHLEWRRPMAPDQRR